MEPIYYTATKSTPAVILDAAENLFKINGESYPENAFEFYNPITKWMSEYIAQMQVPMAFQMRLTYLNTSSTRCMLSLLDILEEAYLAGKKVAVYWYCHPEDERSFEAAEEFKEDLTLPFEIIPSKEDASEANK